MLKLSAFVTTFNDEGTIRACLESLKWVDELVVLDSFSTDRTLEIAREYTTRIEQQTFLGFGPQKQVALEKTTHDWVLFLDSDEAVSPALQQEICRALQGPPDVEGFAIPRREQMFWRMADDGTRHNRFVRLFRKSRTRFSTMPIHAAPDVDGRIGKLHEPFFHFGETSIHEKVEKLNGYSSGLVAYRIEQGDAGHPGKMLWYPPLVFLKQFVGKRHYRNGWAGLIASVCMAFYAFLKCAKVYEEFQRRAPENAQLPTSADSSLEPAPRAVAA
ncbi:MAG: glycosyltransferase family 2 protein [Planctomycetaceae bacterium]|nr:glycosyltransferase family 2 protein [Planctomycetaceae bacterium]